MPDSNQQKSLEERLQRLDSRLRQKKKNDPEKRALSSDSVNFGNAMKLSTEFVVAVLVGSGMGWAIDGFFGTEPWAMIIFLPLGFMAGVRNVMRAAGLSNNHACKKNSGNINRNQKAGVSKKNAD